LGVLPEPDCKGCAGKRLLGRGNLPAQHGLGGSLNFPPPPKKPRMADVANVSPQRGVAGIVRKRSGPGGGKFFRIFAGRRRQGEGGRDRRKKAARSKRELSRMKRLMRGFARIDEKRGESKRDPFRIVPGGGEYFRRISEVDKRKQEVQKRNSGKLSIPKRQGVHVGSRSDEKGNFAQKINNNNEEGNSPVGGK